VTKLISILIILLVLLGAWHLFQYWQRIEREHDNPKREEAGVVRPDRLPGLPGELSLSLEEAERQGGAALGDWLRMYDRYLQDPRKAWIELDYCVLIAKQNPAEARRVFAAVRERTSPASPVWPRIKELEKSYE
jgi:hypothetical protein